MKALFLCFLGLLCAGYGVAQPTRAWNRVLDSSYQIGSENLTIALRNGDLLTYSVIQQGQNNGFMLLRQDTSGNVRWAKTYALAPGDSAINISAQNSGHILAENRFGEIACMIGVQHQRTYPPCLMILDGQTGQTRVRKLIMDNTVPYRMDIEAEASGNFVLLYTWSPFNSGHFATALARFDRQGNLLGAIDYRLNRQDFVLWEHLNLVKYGKGYAFLAKTTIAPWGQFGGSYAVVVVDSALQPVRGIVMQVSNENSGQSALYAVGQNRLMVMQDSAWTNLPISRPYITCLDSTLREVWSRLFYDSAVLGPINFWQAGVHADGNLIGGDGLSMVKITPDGDVASYGKSGRGPVGAIDRNSFPFVGGTTMYLPGQLYNNALYRVLGSNGLAYQRAQPQDSGLFCDVTHVPRLGYQETHFRLDPVSITATAVTPIIGDKSPFLERTPISCRVPYCGDWLQIQDIRTCQFPVRIITDPVFENQRLEWSNGDTGLTATYDSTGQYWVRVITPCFSYLDTFNIYTQVFPVNLPDDTLRSCSGDTIRLGASPQGPGPWRWDDDAGRQVQTTRTGRFVFENTTSQVQLRRIRFRSYQSDNMTCYSTDSQMVAVGPSLPHTLPDSLLLCNGSDTLLNAQTWLPRGDSFTWTLPNGQLRELAFNTRLAGTYTLRYEQDGCRQADSLRIVAPVTVQLGLTLLQPDTCADSVTLAVRPALLPPGAITWWIDAMRMTGYTDTVVRVSVGHYYHAEFTDACGRLESPRVRPIRPNTCDPVPPLEFPNLVTVNGDGINEAYKIGNAPAGAAYPMQVMSRWGAVVFKGNYSTTAWPKSETLPGIYFIHIEHDGQVYRGWVEVVK